GQLSPSVYDDGRGDFSGGVGCDANRRRRRQRPFAGGRGRSRRGIALNSSGRATQMRLDFSGERVLAVVAHPDDAELLCAGTLARAKADGAAVGICVLCNGDKGQPAKPIKNLTAVRRKEMASAASLLSAELFTGGFSDSTLRDEPAQRGKLIEILRRFRPTLVLAHSPQD